MRKLQNWILKKAFNFDNLSVMDRLFLTKKGQHSQSHCVVLMDCEKFEYEPMKEYFLKVWSKFPRMKSKVQYVFGTPYFVPMSDEEWAKK